MQNSEYKVRAEHVSKIFGEAPDRALELLQAGAPKEEIYRETGSVVAVADVSFSVRKGEVFVVMGLSGSGKSTLVRCINRLIPPTAGELYIDGEDIVRVSPQRLREIRLTKIAMVFQHFALLPHKTVAENAEFGLKIRGVPPQIRRERALAALELVGLEAWADTAPANLSGGMQQRVGLARALAVDPEIMLMDEPFSALDPLIRRDMQEELIRLQRDLHMTIVFITHDLHEALTIGDHIAIMKDGSFVQVGTPEEIVAHPKDPYVASFTRDVDRSRVLTARTVMRPVEALPVEETTLARVRERLQTSGEPLYAVDREGRPVGLLLERDLRPGGKAEAAASRSWMRKDFPRVTEDTKLADLFGLCRTGQPIAVVDVEGRLVGAIRPLDVFAQLGSEEAGAQSQGEPRRAPAELAEAGAAHG